MPIISSMSDTQIQACLVAILARQASGVGSCVDVYS